MTPKSTGPGNPERHHTPPPTAKSQAKKTEQDTKAQKPKQEPKKGQQAEGSPSPSAESTQEIKKVGDAAADKNKSAPTAEPATKDKAAEAEKPGKATKVASTNSATVSTTKAEGEKPGVVNTFLASARGEDAAGLGDERELTYVDPKSALRVGFVLSASVGAVFLVASVLLWLILAVTGVWSKLDSLLADITGFGAFGAVQYFLTMIVLGLLETAVMTLLAPVGAMIYNAAVGMVGGLRVRLKTTGRSGK